jgi:hypothetical protein
MSRSIPFNEESLKKYDIFITPDGFYRSRIKKRTYYLHTCSCSNQFLGLKEQVFCSPSCSMSSQSTQEKYKQTMKKEYGSEYNFQREEIKKKIEKNVDPDMVEMLKYTIDLPPK